MKLTTWAIARILLGLAVTFGQHYHAKACDTCATCTTDSDCAAKCGVK